MSDFRIFYETPEGEPGGEFLACTWCGEAFQLKWQPVFSLVASTDEEMFSGGRVRVCFDLCGDCAADLRNDLEAFYANPIEDGEGDDG